MRAHTAEEVAGWPMSPGDIVARPDGRAWAGAPRSYVAMFVLEEEAGTASGLPDATSNVPSLALAHGTSPRWWQFWRRRE